LKFLSTEIPDVVLIEPAIFRDARGLFLERYREEEFQKNALPTQFVQDNISRSLKGTVRGLHYQVEPHAQAKVVHVTQGEVFDVAVDLREGSPYFGKWVGRQLSEENRLALFIPAGFAHGFFVMSEHAEVQYKCSQYYVKESDRAIRWDDPAIGINWPGQPKQELISEKDQKAPLLKNADLNFKYPVNSSNA